MQSYLIFSRPLIILSIQKTLEILAVVFPVSTIFVVRMIISPAWRETASLIVDSMGIVLAIIACVSLALGWSKATAEDAGTFAVFYSKVISDLDQLGPPREAKYDDEQRAKLNSLKEQASQGTVDDLTVKVLGLEKIIPRFRASWRFNKSYPKYRIPK